MAWESITAEDVQTGLSGPELEVLQTSGLAEGQSDPLPAVVAQVVDECRGFIAARAGNTLGPAGTLPPQVRAAALSIIVWRLGGRPAVGKAGELLRSESRRQDYTDALQFMKDVSSGKCAIEQPQETGPETINFSPGKFGSNPKIDFTV